MGRLPVIRRAAALLVAALLAWLAATPAALAHERLVAAEPADGAVLAAPPTQVRLTFSGAVSGPELTVVTATGDGVAVGEPLLDGAVVTLPFPDTLTNGDYRIEWRVVSSDGDPVSGAVALTVAAPVTAPPTTAPATVPATEERATEGRAAGPDPDDDVAAGGDPAVGPWLVAGAAVLALGAAVLVLRGRSGGSARNDPNR